MISFTDCVTEGVNPAFKALAAFDSYFSYSGRGYKIISPQVPGQRSSLAVEPFRSPQNHLLTALKVISLLTLLIPLIMMIGKLICRVQYRFYHKAKLLSHKEMVGVGPSVLKISPHIPKKWQRQARGVAKN